MKKTTLLFFFLCCLQFMSSAQIMEEDRTMTQGTYNALVITIPDTNDKDAQRLWKKFMKTKDARTKKIKRSEEWLSESAEISGLTGETVDVYATFENSGDDVRMVVWFNMGEDYLSSIAYPSRYAAGENILYDFELAMYKEGIKAAIKEEENDLKRLEGALKKAIRDKERYERDIKQAKDKIAKAEANIESNLIEQEDISSQIEEQKKVVKTTKEKMDARDH